MFLYLTAQAAAAVSAAGSGSALAGSALSTALQEAALRRSSIAAEDDEAAESTQQRFDGKSSPNNLSNNDKTETEGCSETELRFSCPLCSEKFSSQEALESHAMSVHSVNSEGLQRLQSLINGSHWLNKKDQGMF